MEHVGENGEGGLHRLRRRVAATLEQLRPGLEVVREVVYGLSRVELVLQLVDEKRVEGGVSDPVDLYEDAVSAHARCGPNANRRPVAEHVVGYLQRHREDVLSGERVVTCELE